MKRTDSTSLQTKRKELITLVNHIRLRPGHNEDSEATNIVLSRILAEVRRAEVEQIRNHILDCPGLSSKSAAYAAALPALEEAIIHINRNSDKLDSSLLSTAALTSSFNEKSVPEVLIEEIILSSSNESSISDPKVEQEEETDYQEKGSPVKARKSSAVVSFFGTIIRCIFLDLPLVTTCLFLVASYCAQSIYHTYYVPILDSVVWDDERREIESTNYMRSCDINDISTLNPDDFIVDPHSTTPDEAVEMTNKHGMTIFPNLLKPETAAAMREYVLRKNYSLTEDEAIWLISNKQRWSFPIGADCDPSVPPVLQEIATDESFVNTINKLMGDDPAMVEFTAITSAYGAGDQHWHADNDNTASQMHYSRSFVPMYSLFVPLQDTTPQMGATSACPGTHLCQDDTGLSELCDNLNFQVSDTRGRLAEREEDHVWKSGDGFLMDLNTYHRGPGHIDPNGTERVMLILSISPRPNGPHFDRRQISLGTSYSIRWDMWGLTFKDLAIMDKIKGFPWKQLRALGIYKAMGSHKNKNVLWGWDHLTVACSRIINEQMGFRAEDVDDLTGKIKKKSKLLYFFFGQNPNDDGLEDTEVWPKYFEETCARCVSYGKMAFGACSFFYLVVSLFQKKRVSSIVRGIKICTIIGTLGALWLRHISMTPWGEDIRSGVAQLSPFPDFGELETGRVTLPVKTDVMFSNRLDSAFLAGHNLIFNHQPGNTAYYELLSKYSVPKFTPAFIMVEIINTIRAGVENTDGRFLSQNDYGDWEVMEDQELLTRIQQDLVTGSNTISKSLAQEIKYLKSESRYGRNRHAKMRTHAEENLSELECRLIGLSLPKKNTTPTSTFLKIHSHASVPKIARSTPKVNTSKKANAGAFEKGDIVEGYSEGDDGWFKGKVSGIQRKKMVAVKFDDGDYQVLPMSEVRKFNHFEIGETVMVNLEVEVIIKYIAANGQVSVIDGDGNEFEVHIFEISRIS
jgi:hypothetical protein